MDEASIFLEALQKTTPTERAAYLDQACAGDDELRRNVEMLLRAQAKAGDFLNQPAAAAIATVDEPITERPGTVIGPYRLMEQIGEGGMGLVFVAEQQHPVRRKVALKVIKPGMDSRQVIARFEAERQALALMDHPNIARVLDGGTTGGVVSSQLSVVSKNEGAGASLTTDNLQLTTAGRPYFVMELVKGVPITEYCDQNQLPIRQRLELFGDVCAAVQHAHQKGIIHRDIKPSNVLVVSHDGKPVVKVIDFGIAKAIGQQLTDKTIYTQFSQLVGTPLYMSPEQAGQSGVDVDTRTDIYALGVLLYELLTGTTPFDKERLRNAAYDEIRRIIREEEPPRPSTRISTLGQAATTISAQRKSEPKKLSQLVRGELDWIVMKALEKDRNRRYESASAFAADVRRYLNDEPVQACPPSQWYRLRKAACRNKVALAMASFVLVAVLLGMIGLAVANYRITQERDLAQREHEQAEANLQQARMAVEDYLTTVSENTLLKSSLPGLQPLRKELLQTALRYYQGFVRDHQDNPTLRFELAAATFRVGVITAEIASHEKGLRYLVEARDLLQEMADADPSRADYQRELGRCLIRIGYVTSFSKSEEAIAPFKQGIDILEAITPDHLLESDLAFGHHYLAHELAKLGRWGQARQHCRRAIELRQELADRYPSEPRYRSDLALSMNNLAHAQIYDNRPDEALQTAQQAEVIVRALVREHPWDAPMRRTLALSIGTQAIVHRALGRKEETLACLRQASEIMHKVSAENPSDIDLQGRAARCFASYAQTLIDENGLEPAEQALARAQEHAEVAAKENPKDSTSVSTLSSIHRNRGKVLGKKGKPAEALGELREAVAIEERLAPQWNMMRYDLACSLSLCSAMAGRIGAQAEAEQYARRALIELHRAWEQGWKEIQLMERDPDLDALRERADFRRLMDELKAGRR